MYSYILGVYINLYKPSLIIYTMPNKGYKYEIIDVTCNECKDIFKAIYKTKRCNKCKKIHESKLRIIALKKWGWNEYQNKRKLKIKTQIFEHYGMKCNCCDEREFKFLTLDHIIDNPKQKKKAKNNQITVYVWIIKNNFPEGFQILCFNCNIAKGLYGKCPHNNI